MISFLLLFQATFTRNNLAADLNTGQFLALEQFEARPASGGDVTHFFGKAEFVHRCDRIAAADDGRRSLARGLGDELGDLAGALREGVEFEDADGAVPHDSLGLGDDLFVFREGLGADVHAHESLGYIEAVDRFWTCGCVEGLGADMIDRQDDFSACFFSGLEYVAGGVELVVLDQGLADGMALCLEEGVGHASADHEGLCVFQKRFEDGDLGRDLRTAYDRDEGLFGIRHDGLEIGDLFFHEEAADRGFHELRDRGGRGVVAVGGPEGVVHEDLAVRSQFLGKLVPLGRILARLFLMEAGVLEHDDGPVLLGLDEGFFAETAVLAREHHGSAELVGQVGGHRGHAVLARDIGCLVEGLAVLLGLLLGLFHVLLGIAQVRHEDQALHALVHDVLYRGDGRDDARVVLHLAVLHGHVEIDAHHHALSFELNVLDCLDHDRLPGSDSEKTRPPRGAAFIAELLLFLRGHVPEQVDDAVRIAPLVVVPADELEEALLAGQVVLLRGEAVVDRGAVVMNEVGRDKLLTAVSENALQVGLGGLLEQAVDLLDGAVAGRGEGQVDDGDVEGGDAEGHAGELALGLGKDFADSLGRSGGRGDDIDRGRAAAAPVLLGNAVDRFLSRGGRVDRGHETAVDADALLHEHVDEGGEAVGGAGGVRDDDVLRGIVLFLVDAHDEGRDLLGLVGALGGSGDDDPLRTGLEVTPGLLVAEEARGLDDVLDAELGPGQVLEFLLGQDALHLVAVHDEDVGLGEGGIALLRRNIGLHAAVDRVVLELVGEILGVGRDIDDGDDIDLILPEQALLYQGLENEAADSTKSVNSYLHRRSSCGGQIYIFVPKP